MQRDGYIVQLLDTEKAANGVKGINQVSIHVAYIGGVDDRLHPIDNRTNEQKHSLKVLLTVLKIDHAGAIICGHRDFAPKDCPCFDAKKEYEKL